MTHPNSDNASAKSSESSLVLYCIVRREEGGGDPAARFLVMQKPGGWTFPPTKLRPGEDLYSALKRPLAEDLGLPDGSYFPEEELPMIPNEQPGPSYHGLPERWRLYPVDVSLSSEGMAAVESSAADVRWWRIDELLSNVEEPNVRAIAYQLQETRPDLTTGARGEPSQEALACDWAARNRGGVRVAPGSEIREVLEAGSRAFNLRVADL